MPSLVYQLGPAAKVVPVTAGELTIGRDRSNDVILNHPTVGRRHARVVVEADGSVWLGDLGSCNGTRVDGVPVARRTRLVAPCRLRVGRVRVWFREEAADAAVIVGAARGDGEAAGVVRRCACGSRVWMVEDPGDRSVICRRCGKPVDPDDAAATTGDATAAGEATAMPSASPGETILNAAVVESASVCPVCRWAVEPGDLNRRCGECGMVYHAECWSQNHGCATFGCAQVGAADAERPRRPAVPVLRGGAAAGDSAADMTTISEERFVADPVVRRRVTARRLAAANLAASVAGLPAFGLPPLAVATASAVWLKHRAAGEELPAVAAVLIGLGGAALGAAASVYWWL